MIEQALFQLFSTDSNLLAALGSRVYPVRAPQGCALPYAVYERTQTDKNYTCDGPTDLLSSTVTLTLYAATYSECKQLADYTRQHEDFAGQVAVSGDPSPITIQSLRIDDEFDDYNPPDSSDEIGQYAVQQDWRVQWNQVLE